MNNVYHKASHCYYLTQYHIIWHTKLREPILKNDVNENLKKIFAEICVRYGYKIKTLKITLDRIYIFIDCPHTVAPCDVARTLKSVSAIELFKVYPELKEFYARCGALWSEGYLISSLEQISEETVRQYTEEKFLISEEDF